MIHFVALQLMVHLVLIEIDMLCAALARTHHLQEKTGAWVIRSAVLENWHVTHIEHTVASERAGCLNILLSTQEKNSNVTWLAAAFCF